MNWKTFAATAGALLILPLGTYAAQSTQAANITTNNILESDNSNNSSVIHLAQGNKRGKKGDRGERMGKLLEQLDLTPEQSQNIEAIQNQSKTDKEALRSQMRSQHESMKSLLASDADIEQIRQKHQETLELRQQLGNDRFETMLQVREVLTTEQRAKMAELMEQHHERQGDR